ncbi:MAG: cation:proton antiporter [Magnetococcales bacterium]|nr:cation:proton antiporter [Magnetococcales bacterium]MBF0321575.1 cation:proton antiporter [Magnetococcales bacterium]
MTTSAVFFTQSLLVIGLPYVVWRLPGVHGMVPLVVLQILLGVAMGPSVLGSVAPETWATLFANDAIKGLTGPAWLAIVLFTFLTGLHLDSTELKLLGKRFAFVSLFSFLVPCLIGGLAGAFVAEHFPESMGPNATRWYFTIAIGLSSGVTALPVLGAILRETGLMEHRLGRITLGMAAVNDAILWAILAVFLAAATSSGQEFSGSFWAPLAIVPYLLIMVLVIGPMLRRTLTHESIRGDTGLITVCISVFGSALATEWIGLHVALGGFIIGVVMPRIHKQTLIDRLEPLTVVVLLPFFFALTGMRTSFDVTSDHLVTITMIVTVVGIVGKFVGTTFPARWIGESWAGAIKLGILMQTKGMMEVLILAIFREAGIISDSCFSAMMFMAIITTFLTLPMLRGVLKLTGQVRKA